MTGLLAVEVEASPLAAEGLEAFETGLLVARDGGLLEGAVACVSTGDECHQFDKAHLPGPFWSVLFEMSLRG